MTPLDPTAPGTFGALVAAPAVPFAVTGGVAVVDAGTAGTRGSGAFARGASGPG
jgi:hypothetical protein